MHVKPGLVVEANIWEVFDGALVVLPADADLAGFEQAPVASARFWMPSGLLGHTDG